MAHVISLIILVIVTVVFSSSWTVFRFAMPSASFNQTNQIRFDLVPILLFFLVHTITYWSIRLSKGRDTVGTYTGSKINYFCLLAVVVYFLLSVNNVFPWFFKLTFWIS